MTTTINESNSTAPSEPTPTLGLRPRRTLNRLATASGSVALGAVGQYFFSQNSVWEGLLLYTLAAVIFVRAVGLHLYPNYKLNLPNPTLAHILSIHTNWRRLTGIWAMLLGLVASGLGYFLFGQSDALTQGWWIYLASLVLFVTGGLILTPGVSLRAELKRLVPNRNIALGLALVLLLALALRLFNFTQQPFGIWFDEAEAGLQARAILQDPNHRPVFYPPINITGHMLYFYAAALAWLGDTIYAMRLVSVLFGLGGILAAYLFGREVRSPRFGLLLAFLLAVARWHINFSRIAMTGIDTPFFELLTLFFLTRLLRYGRLRDAMWAGLSMGLGLLFYTAFRLYLLTLLIFAIVALMRWWSPVLVALRDGGWRRTLGAAAVLLFSVWMVVMPLVQYAVDHPDAFMYRTRQISIFTKRDQANLGLAITESARKHLLMFNVSGDKNGRHNLPGEPMLDPIMGIFLILGIGLAVTQTRFPANLFFLILLPVALLGGIFSVDFEAPQSLRSIAVMPAIIYFAALSLTALGKEAERSLQTLPRAWLYIPAVLVGLYILSLNAHTYFVRQANDFASWNAFSAPETITGRKMAELGPDYVYILSPFLTNHPSSRFLAPEITNQQHLALPDALPVRDPSGRAVALFLHPDDKWVYEQALRLYPDALFEVLTGPASPDQDVGPASVYMVLLEPGDLLAVRGLDLRYWPAANSNAPEAQLLAPLQAGRAYSISANWPADAPPTAEFEAEWSGVLYAPRYGPYTFRLVTPAAGLLELDGSPILEEQGEQLTTITLAEGNHQIRIRAVGAPGQVNLFWQPPGQNEEPLPAWALYSRPVTNHGLLGSYYPNNNWEGPPAFRQVDPFLDTYFHLVPLQRPYTVEWAGSLVAPQSGVYKLGLRAVQEAQLFINGQLLLSTIAPDEYTEAVLDLEAGLHDLLIRYRDTVDRSRIHLLWTPPGGSIEPIPSDYLWPPMGSYPEPDHVPQATTEILSLGLRHEFSLGGFGSESGQFSEPRDVALFSDGRIAVADTGNRRVQMFDQNLGVVAELNGDDFSFDEPLAVEVLRRDNGDELLVLDSGLQWVYRYDAGGNFLDRFGGSEARLFHPRGMTAFNDTQLVAIADTGSARIALFDADGLPVGSIGSGPGNAPGQLNEPTDVAKDSLNTYFVAEAENDRIQRLDIGGNSLNQWPIPPAYAYNGPHLAFAPDGSLFMTESQSQSLLRYTPAGVLVDQWQTIGPVRFIAPVGIYFDPITSRLYVTDVASHQVHAFTVELLTE